MSIDPISVLAVATGLVPAQSVEPIITQESRDLAHELVERFGVHRGGSYLVKGNYANDIDLFMTNDVFVGVCDWLYKNGHNITVNDAGAKLYEDDGGYALHAVVNIGQVQLIVVKDHYEPAYIKAAEMMQRDPGQFQDKADRVALHRILRYMIHYKE